MVIRKKQKKKKINYTILVLGTVSAVIVLWILFVQVGEVECAEFGMPKAKAALKASIRFFSPDTGETCTWKYDVPRTVQYFQAFCIQNDIYCRDLDEFTEVYRRYILLEKIIPVQMRDLNGMTYIEHQHEFVIRLLNRIEDKVYRHGENANLWNTPKGIQMPQSVAEYIARERIHLSVDRFFEACRVDESKISADAWRFVHLRYTDSYIDRVGGALSRLRYEFFIGHPLTAEDVAEHKRIVSGIVRDEVDRIKLKRKT